MSASTPAPIVPPIWTTGSTEVFKTGTWRAALPLHVHADSPCRAACPVHGEIAEWIGHARAGDWRAAWRRLADNNPFPAIAGRICHHPCESACNRSGLDGAVSICRLERHAGDAAIEAGWSFEPPTAERAGHVAIVGAGPAGLSAAYQLRRRGWRVTVYEARDEPGGLMRHGIPSYRLAREVLDAEIGRIVSLGVELRCGTPVADAAMLDALRATHDAVFVATGAARVKRLPALDYRAPWVIDGAAYLEAANAGEPPALGRRVVVIGGGSAAFDAARSALRAGHAVTVLALESRAQLPAQRDEVDEAIEEGVALVDGAMLCAASVGADGALRLDCGQVRLVAGAARGEFRVEPVDGAGFAIVADAVLTSIGNDPDLAPFGGALPAGDGVWTGGDLASTERFVTEAIGMGRRAALEIHRRLSGEAGGAADARLAPVPLSSIATWYHPEATRVPAALRPVAERVASGAEVQCGLSARQALAEAARCFSCGTCVHCDNCIVVCPDLAVRRTVSAGATGAAAGVGVGYEVLADYCKGCGLCVRECPAGSMTMVEERR